MFERTARLAPAVVVVIVIPVLAVFLLFLLLVVPLVVRLYLFRIQVCERITHTSARPKRLINDTAAAAVRAARIVTWKRNRYVEERAGLLWRFSAARRMYVTVCIDFSMTHSLDEFGADLCALEGESVVIRRNCRTRHSPAYWLDRKGTFSSLSRSPKKIDILSCTGYPCSVALNSTSRVIRRPSSKVNAREVDVNLIKYVRPNERFMNHTRRRMRLSSPCVESKGRGAQF